MPRAHLSVEQAQNLAQQHYGIQGVVTELEGELDRNFKIQTDSGAFVLRVTRENLPEILLDAWVQSLLHIREEGLPVSKPIPQTEGVLWSKIILETKTHHLWMTSWLNGTPLCDHPKPSPEIYDQIGALVGTLRNSLRNWEHPGLRREFEWDVRQGIQVVEDSILHIEEPRQQRVVHETLGSIKAAMDGLDPDFEVGTIHGDCNDHNLLLNEEGNLCGLIDIGDACESWRIADLAIASAYALLDADEPLEALTRLTQSSFTACPFPEQEFSALWPLLRLRLCVSLSMSWVQQKRDPENHYLSATRIPAFNLLKDLLRVDGLEVEHSLRATCGVPPRIASSTSALQERRKATFGSNLSLSYDSPLHISHGAGRYLFDSCGVGYLDGVNNVPHVGHSHPAIVDAAVRQLRNTNTNTRYLHEGRQEYAEALAETFPDPLSVVYFVNSGSEANELAIRLATAHTQGSDWITLDAAYHGNTQNLVDLSPYKFDGPGGKGRAAHVQVAELPDLFRGRHSNSDAGMEYAKDLHRCLAAIAERGASPAFFIAEAIPGCGGQMVLPEGYLARAAATVRAAGAVFICDEVQTGFARAGEHFWAFESQGVVPDIVTVGKPIGNGHPMGAVITTPAIARSFDTGMEYFNTFGGNPVSCAIGHAVLKTIEKEGLQENARRTGEVLLQGLQELVDEFPSIGYARGLGLFCGAVCVRPNSKEPDAAKASRIVNQLRADRVLLSTDGPHHDVLKMKPPLVFQPADAHHLLSRMRHHLKEG